MSRPIDADESRVRAARLGVAVRLALAAALVLGLGVTSTSAAWQDSERASASFTSATLPAPALTKPCKYKPGLLGLGARVEIYWDLPAGYVLDEARLEASTSGLGSVLAPITGFSLNAQTKPSGSGYVTTVPVNLLGGLLGLGSELEIAITVSRYGWTSDPAAVATNAGLLAGLGGSCRNLS